MKGNRIDFEIEKIFFYIKVLGLLLGSASKCDFLQYFHCAKKGNLIDFKMEKIVFICFDIEVSSLPLGSASDAIFCNIFIALYKEI